MGMFDSVIFICPKCGADIEVQSKAGRCNLDRFNPRKVPLPVALSIDDEIVACEGGWSFDKHYDGCGASWRVQPDIHVPETVAMKLKEV